MKSKSILTRYEGNPLFDPADFPYYRVEQIFNPGQVMTPDGRTILILSVLPMGASRPCCHVAESADGLHFEIQQEPCFTFENSAFQGYDGWPIDCRVTFFAEENCYYIIRRGPRPGGAAVPDGGFPDIRADRHHLPALQPRSVSLPGKNRR